jgi:hypothetical protein
MLALSLAACSTGSQSGCSQTAVQSYKTPSMVSPTNGATGVSGAIGTIQIQSQQLTLPGSLTLTSASGASVTLGTPVAAKNQPVPTGTLFNVPVATLASGTQYNLGWTITYPGSCLGPSVVKSATWGSFTTQ